MKNKLESLIFNTVYKLLEINTISIPSNLKELLKKKMIEEKEKGSQLAYEQITLILKNLEFGEKNKLPICQDTGMINIIFKFSPKFRFPNNFKDIINESIKFATEKIPLRPNTIDPIDEKISNTNTGINTPPIYYEFSNEIEYLEIIVINKGGGAENMSKLLLLSPSTDITEIKRNILNLVKEASGKPCPPIILGIGLGGDATYCMYLAKKALIRPLYSRNPRKEIRNLEDELLTEINELGVGVMGFGGLTTCLDVRIEWALRHPASYPVGIIFQCYSHRISKAIIDSKLNIKIIHD